MSEFELRRALRGLAPERAPSRDLWPGIAARIGGADRAGTRPAARPARRWSWLALAASLLLAVLLALPRLPQHAEPGSGAAPGLSQLAPPQAAPQARSLQLQADALTLEYVAALDQLGGQQLPPTLAPALAELDSSATQIRAALRQDPDARFLLDQLRRTYDQRLRLTQLALTRPTSIVG